MRRPLPHVHARARTRPDSPLPQRGLMSAALPLQSPASVTGTPAASSAAVSKSTGAVPNASTTKSQGDAHVLAVRAGGLHAPSTMRSTLVCVSCATPCSSKSAIMNGSTGGGFLGCYRIEHLHNGHRAVLLGLGQVFGSLCAHKATADDYHVAMGLRCARQHVHESSTNGRFAPGMDGTMLRPPTATTAASGALGQYACGVGGLPQLHAHADGVECGDEPVARARPSRPFAAARSLCPVARPSLSACSNSTTSCPRRAATRAASMPAGPPPTTTTFFGASAGSLRRDRTRSAVFGVQHAREEAAVLDGVGAALVAHDARADELGRARFEFAHVVGDRPTSERPRQ